MELSAASTPAGGTQGHHATGNGVLWRMLVAGLLALSVGAENFDVATLWSLELSQKMLGRVVCIVPRVMSPYAALNKDTVALL